MNNKFIFVFLFSILLLGTVSALEINPFATVVTHETEVTEDLDPYLVDEFNSDYGSIELEDTTFWIGTKKIAEYTLIENTDKCLINCYAEGKAVLHEEGALFEDLFFEDKNGDVRPDINGDIYLWGTKEITENVLRETGENYFPENNTVSPIHSYVDETRTIEDWVIYNKEIKAVGNYRWRIEGMKRASEDLDWIFLKEEKALKQWAWWEGEDNKEIINFTANDTWVIPAGVESATVYVIGGGGGGVAMDRPSGSGAGAVLIDTNHDLTGYGGSVSVVVGIGGAGLHWTTGMVANRGQNSSFGTLIANGGGGAIGQDGNACTDAEYAQRNGGSGGGGGACASPRNDYLGGLAFDGTQGNDGGDGSSSGSLRAGGGGGGYGSVGADVTVAHEGGVGGSGLDLLGLKLARGGHGVGSSLAGVSANATANTGDGANSTQYGATNFGGSGIVIIIYNLSSGSPPEVTLNTPVNLFNTSSDTIHFNVDATDNFEIVNVSLLIDDVIVQTDTSGVNGTYIFDETTATGFHNWSILAYDNDSEFTLSDPRTFNITLVGPEVTLNSPANATDSATPTINFNVDVTDDFKVQNVSLIIDGIIDQTDTTNVNGTYILSKSLTEGVHIWSILAFDNHSLSSQSINRSVNITIVPPTINLFSPVNNFATNSTNITFIGSVTDDFSIQNVSFYLNGTLNETNSSGLKDVNYSFNKLLTDGTYTWRYKAYDNDSFMSDSSTRTLTIDTINPIVSILSPENISYITNVTTMNFVVNEINPSHSWYSKDNGITNASIQSGLANFTGIISVQGQNTWVVYSNDTAGNEGQSTISFFMDTIVPTINIAYPVNAANYTVAQTELNFSFVETNWDTCWFSDDDGITNSSFQSCQLNFTGLLSSEGQNDWVVYINDTSGNEFQDSTSFFAHTVAPTINITTPTGFEDYFLIGGNQTLNYNVTELGYSEAHLIDCNLEYNNSNVSLDCGGTNLSFVYVSGMNNLTVYAEDEYGLVSSEFTSWNYKIVEDAQTFVTPTTEGSLETYSINLTKDSTVAIAKIDLVLEGTDYSTSVSTVSNDVFATVTAPVPAVTVPTNKTFYFEITLTDSTVMNSSSNIQLVNDVQIDDCSVYTTVIFNFTLVDEETQISFTEVLDESSYVEVDIDVLTPNTDNVILNIFQEFGNESSPDVCVSVNLTETGYDVDAVVKYFGIVNDGGHSAEYYTLDGFRMTSLNTPQEITLYDMPLDKATDFLLKFKDASSIPAENVIIQINRQYVSEGVFKTVEQPMTDSDGQTILHLVEKDVIYNIIATREGSILGNFENVVAFCEDPTTSKCIINLRESPDDINFFDYNSQFSINYDPSYNSTTRVINFDFSSKDGSVKDVRIIVSKFDALGGDEICDEEILTASGTLSCTAPATIGNASLILEVFVDDEKITEFSLDDTNKKPYGAIGYFAFFVLFSSLIMMMSNSKTGVVMGSMIGFISAAYLSLYDSGALGVTAGIMWLVVAGGILLYKLNSSQENST